jgi:hypothetical protein
MGKAAAPASIQSQQTSDGMLCSATILCLSAAAEHPLSSRQIGPPPDRRLVSPVVLIPCRLRLRSSSALLYGRSPAGEPPDHANASSM